MTYPLSRRQFLHATAGVAAMPFGAAWLHAVAADEAPKKRLASVNSVYYKLSHAYHIVGRLLHGYPIQGKHHQPAYEIARMYNQQYHKGERMTDLSAGVAKRFGFPLVDSVAEAVGDVDVDGVLLIAEHGDYPENDRGQILYPRYEFFETIVDQFRKAKKTVPVFVDKHLSYDYQKARKMYDTAKRMGFGLMAGSSLPVTWRQPEWEPDHGSDIEELVVCYHGGHREVWAIHALETAQCLLERRKGGETGIKQVRAFEGQAVWDAWAKKEWDLGLTEAALRRSGSRDYGTPQDQVENPMAIQLEYFDGTKATLLHLPGYVFDITAAAKVKNDPKPQAAWFVLPLPPGARFFTPLTWYIEQFFATGKSPYPVERTLLSSTALDFAMRSLADGGTPIRHDAMKIAYQTPKESWFFRGPFSDD